MFTSHLVRWFSGLAECAIPADRPLLVAPAIPGGRAPSPRAAAPAIKVKISRSAGDMVIQVTGDAGVECAGALQDGLLASAACRPAVVTLDLRELRSISCLAMRVLVAYRRGVVRTGGRVRLAETLQPAVREALGRAELLGLFESTAHRDLVPHGQPGPPPSIQAIS